MTPTRRAMFDALRPFAGPRGFNDPQIAAADALADLFGLAREAAPSLTLTAQDYADAARELGCSVAQIKAVFEVEASGSGWFTDVRGEILMLDGPGGFIDGVNLPKILFEAHIFDRETDGRFRRSNPDLSSASWNKALYVGGQGEYARLHRAMQLDRRAALRSASWGAAQIMGFNHALAGYDTVEAFVEAMRTGVRAHLMAFVAFVKKSDLAPALRRITASADSARDFARVYNGSAYAKNGYHTKIAAAFAKWTRA